MYQKSYVRRLFDATTAEECSAEMAAARARVKTAVDESIRESKRVRQQLDLAKAATRLAKNKAVRAQHLTEIRQQCNEGPAWGSQYLMIAEHQDRPAVRAYNRAVGHPHGAVTGFESSQKPYEQFNASLQSKHTHTPLPC